MTPRIYVGTYAKYNNGSIAGKWLDLADYDDRAEFYEACATLHADEHDPEFMFQDHEGVPAGMVSESHVSDELFDWLKLSEEQQETVAVYQKHVDADGTIEQALERFAGKFDSEEDWARDMLTEGGFFSQWQPGYHDQQTQRAHENWLEVVERYFDFEAYARDCRLGGDMVFVQHEGDVWCFNAN